MRAVFLAAAEEDLRELRRYIVKTFGKSTWQGTYQGLKESVRTIQTFPQVGSTPDELVELSLQQYRQVISGMNRIVYEVREGVIYIHMICDTRRDTRTLLSHRLLRVARC